MSAIALMTVMLVFAFTFTNGFQDASSVAATFIASRSATPKQGIVLVACMSILGAVFGGSAVAFTLSGILTIGSGDTAILVILVAVLSATFWNLVTWRYGLPSSSTHALIGGLAGAGIAAAGTGSIYWGIDELFGPGGQLVGMTKILVFFALSVLIGFAGSYLMQKGTGVLLLNAKRQVNRQIIRMNWVAAGLMSFANGANDSQKQLGIIALILFSAGELATLDAPMWARAGCALLIGAGTLSGGWRIMNTLGRKIFKIEPVHSFDSQFSSGCSIAFSTLAGAPVSSSHIISTSVLGVGAAENPKKVRWFVGKEILIAMIMTIPVTMAIAAGAYLLISFF